MSSGQRRVLLGVGGLLLAFVLFWLGINSIFLMLVALILVLLALLIVKRNRPELFSCFSRKKPEINVKPDEKPAPKCDKTYVVLSEGAGADAKHIAVDRPVYRIGRADDCNCVLPGKGISRHHLRIEYSETEGACYAVDEDSKNGTYLNSGRMEVGVRYRLTQGDRIAIDDRAFTVEYAHY